MATQFGLLVLSIAFQSLLAYALLLEGRGAYAACLIFGVLFAAMFTPGAAIGAQYFVMAKRFSVSQGVATASTICAVGAVVAALVAVPLIHSDIPFFQKADTRSFYLAVALIPLIAYSSALRAQLGALRRFTKLALFSLVQMTTGVVAVLILVRGFDLGVDGAVMSIAVGQAVSIAVCLLYLRRSCGLAPEIPTRANLGRVLGYGWRGHVSQTGSVIGERVGVVFLGIVASQSDIGLFAVGIAMMTRFFILRNAIVSSILPRVAADERGLPELVTFSVRATGWITAAALLGFLAVSTPIVKVLLSEAFLPVVPLLWIMAFGVLIDAPAQVVVAYFRGVNRPAVVSWTVGLGLVTNVASLLILYPALGIEAVAWSMTITYVFRSVFVVVVYLRSTRTPWVSLGLPQHGDLERMLNLVRGVLRRRDLRQTADA